MKILPSIVKSTSSRPVPKLCHVQADGDLWFNPSLCGHNTTGRTMSESQYLSGFGPGPNKEFCQPCVDELVKRHPHPELIDLQRTEL